MAKMGLHANEHADAGNVANGPAGPVLPALGVADAKAIWTAAQQPGMPFVAPKDESQQCVLSLHAMRRLRVKMRTAGQPVARHAARIRRPFSVRTESRLVGDRAAHSRNRERSVPPMLFEFVCEQLQSIERLDAEIGRLEQQFAWRKPGRLTKSTSPAYMNALFRVQIKVSIRRPSFYIQWCA